MATPAVTPQKKQGGGIGGFLKAAAPFIAQGLSMAGPFGALAGGMIQKALGSTKPPTSIEEAEDQYTAALQTAGGSAELIEKARQADRDYQLQLNQMQIDSLEKFVALANANTADARAREIAVKDHMNRNLAWAAVLMLLFCVSLLAFVNLPAGGKEAILLLMGTISASYKDVYNYFFGSSSGSDRKTELLAGSPAK